MHLASDNIHSYRSAGGRWARCRVRIYLPDDMRDAPVVICSELPNNPGGSITNSVEVIAARVIRSNRLSTPLVWIEHWPKESTGGKEETSELAVCRLYRDAHAESRAGPISSRLAFSLSLRRPGPPA
jgi:hypothetical protein